ncbi:MAG TPA: ATP-binding protein [Marinagarivorans sp.]
MTQMRRLLQCLCFIAAYSCASTSFAAVWPDAVIDLAEESQGQPIADKVNYWPDPRAVDAEAALLAGQFRPVGSDVFTFHAKKHWYALTVANYSDHAVRYYLATGLPTTPHLRTYWVDELTVRPQFLLSGQQPYTDRAVQYPLVFIPVELPAQSTKQLLIEHQSLANYPLALRVVSAQVLQEKMSLFTLARGLVLGALFVFLVFFIVQAYLAPSRALVYYCCYIASLIFLVGQIFGYNFTYLWPSSGPFNQLFTPMIAGFTYGFYYLFSAHLFDLRRRNRRLYQFAVGLAFCAFALALINIFSDVFWLLAALALIGLPVPVIIAVWARRQRLTSANLFLAGSILHCSLSYLLALECLGVHLGYSYYLFSFLSVGQLVDLALFSTALLRQASQLRKDLHEQLEQRVRDAEALASVEKGRAKVLAIRKDEALTLAAATHDLNQPLAAIRFALALVDDQEKTGAKAHIVNTLNYTEDLLRSMTQHGKADYERASQQVFAQAMFSQIEQRQQGLYVEKGLKFTVRFAVTEFDCMPVLLQRIVDNLLVNAARYTSSGGVLLSVRPRVGRGVLIQVWDTGCGMTPAQVEQFERPFTQASSQALQGFGLGLFIVKTLAEKAGYSLNIRSKLDQGTCVSLLVPQ